MDKQTDRKRSAIICRSLLYDNNYYLTNLHSFVVDERINCFRTRFVVCFVHSNSKLGPTIISEYRN